MSRHTPHPFDIEVFYDGGCPLCLREITWLRRLDRNHRIAFVDIDSPEFDPSGLGKTYDELMARMHGRLPDGTWLEGVEVFRRLYHAVGFRRLTALSRLPLIAQLLNLGYDLFARNRLRLTGRCSSDRCAVDRAPHHHHAPAREPIHQPDAPASALSTTRHQPDAPARVPTH
jgi:predicted DCC family thiol-disulfide oxidoreductase YuxK